jgi:formiminotetrahydrofolate cyclodeaminase
MESAIRDLINEFSARAPTPAAGAAAALSLSQGAALGVKVVRYAWSGRAGAEVKASSRAAEDELLRVAEGALPKFEEDCRAVRALVSHFRASRDGRRPEDVDLDDAILVPSGLLSLASEGLAALERVIGIVKRALLCEAGASASLMWTAAEVSYWIVRNNAAWLGGDEKWSGTLDSAVAARRAARTSYEAVCSVVDEALSRTAS